MANSTSAGSGSPAVRGRCRCSRRLALILSLAAVGGAVGILASWWLGRWSLLTIGGGAPMAPSAALAVVLLASAVVLRVMRPEGRATRWFEMTAVGLVVVGSVWVLIGSWQGRHPYWEDLLMPKAGASLCASEHQGRPGEFVVGHMAPMAAVLLLLAVGALVLTVPRIAERRWCWGVGLSCGIAACVLAVLPLLVACVKFCKSGSVVWWSEWIKGFMGWGAGEGAQLLPRSRIEQRGGRGGGQPPRRFRRP